MAYKYSNTNYSKEHMARAVGIALPISTKQSIEICNRIRKKTVMQAKAMLNKAVSMKQAIKFTRFTNGAGHKGGIGPGKYPVNASKEILKILDAVEANAQFKGLNTSELVIEHVNAQNAGNVWRYGRHRRRKMKRTHIEIIVKEGKKKTEKKEADKKEGRKKPQAAEKKETKKEEKKAEKSDAKDNKKQEEKKEEPKTNDTKKEEGKE